MPFQEAGPDAAHWSSIGPPDAPDRRLLEHAFGHGRVLLTQDLDFGALLAQGGEHSPSVIQFRAQAVLPVDIGAQLLAALNAAEAHLSAGAMVTIDPVAHRITLLPLQR